VNRFELSNRLPTGVRRVFLHTARGRMDYGLITASGLWLDEPHPPMQLTGRTPAEWLTEIEASQ